MKLLKSYLEFIAEQDFNLIRDAGYDLKGIPDHCVLDKLLRYEGAIQRELSRACDRLERLQRHRNGEPVPPPLRLHLNR